jgi:pimeloyl-ACP methyl ester carboxylesterase
VSLWRDFPDRLSAGTGLSALVYSRQGYGASEPAKLPRPVSFMHDEADRVLPAVLDAAGIHDAILVGHSDGASIALLHAAHARSHGRVRGVVAMAPHVFVEDVTIASIARARDAYRSTDLRARLLRHHGDNVDCAFLGWSGAWLDPAFRSWNIEAEIEKVACPMLLVQGEDDEYGTLAQLTSIARHARVPVTTCILARCGHSPQRDRPEATLEAIGAFTGALG